MKTTNPTSRPAAGWAPVAALAAIPLLQACGVALEARVPGPAYHGASVEEVRDVPPGHMPPPGSCRIWYPGEPPGHQPPAGDCNELVRSVPGGAWLIHRPTSERRVYRIG